MVHDYKGSLQSIGGQPITGWRKEVGHGAGLQWRSSPSPPDRIRARHPSPALITRTVGLRWTASLHLNNRNEVHTDDKRTDSIGSSMTLRSRGH